ncbi:MAG: hypothetical protein QOI21_6211 [Actinomycetota bacterium]|jgi:hypothetical protein|nr:hypothetical protein [Actinomycetota bacterium]
MTTTIRYEPIMTEALAALGGGSIPPATLSRACLTGRLDPTRTRFERGWQVLEELLATATFEPNMVRLIADRGRVEPDLYLATTLSGGIVKRSLRAEVLLHELSNGATLTVNGADLLHTGLQADRELLEYAVGRIAWCNGFVSHTGVSAFGRHHDNHDVVVIQAEGTKHWRVFDPALDTVVFDAITGPGDVLHVPTGWDHEVTGTGEPSVHWTFGFRVPSGSELVLDELNHRVRQGEDLVAHNGFDADVDTLDTAARIRSLDRRAGANLPWAFGAELPALDELMVRWAARLPPVVMPTDDRLSVATLGRRYRVDARFEQPMRLLARGGRVRGSALVDGVAPEAAIRTFLTWALEQRLVLLEPVRFPG